MSRFGAELRRLRQHAGLSQEALATGAGLSTEAISLLERGRRSARMTTMRLLADALGLDDAHRTAFFATQSVELSAQPLPRPAGSLLGRGDDVDALTRLLTGGSARLVTVCGPGGVGKTRVAIATAVEVGEQLAGGARWLPIGSTREPEALLPAIGSALGVRFVGEPSEQQIVEHVGQQQVLLVVDNAEHLVAAVADLARALLDGCADVRLLVTSRHQLRLPEEMVYPLPPLEVPHSGAQADDLLHLPSSRLFLERSGRLLSTSEGAGPDEPLGGAEAAAVTRICRRLDGLPLALELAAARTEVLAIPELAEALDESLVILREPAGRQLTSVIVGWSYDLLTEPEQVVFRRLSVFAGRFGRDGAEALAGDGLDGADLLGVLSSLVATSLLQRVADANGRARFRLLQLIREFAAERLADSGEGDHVRRCHAAYVADWVEPCASQLTGHDQQAALDRLDASLADIRSAFGWLLGHDPARAQRLVGTLWRWSYLRGRYAEGRAWAEAALAAAPSSPAADRASALAGAGMLAFLQCEYELAARHLTECNALYTQLGDERGRGWTLSRLGSIARERGDYPAARRLHTEALEIARAAQRQHEMGNELSLLAFAAWLAGDLEEAAELAHDALEVMTALGDREGMAWALINLGAPARYRGDLAGARLLVSQAAELSEEIGFREGMAWCSDHLGRLARDAGDLEGAHGLLLDSLAAHRELGDRWREASVLDALASVELAAGDPFTAAGHLAAADRLRRDIAVPVPLIERAPRERTHAGCREALGPAYEAAVVTAGLPRSARALP